MEISLHHKSAENRAGVDFLIQSEINLVLRLMDKLSKPVSASIADSLLFV